MSCVGLLRCVQGLNGEIFGGNPEQSWVESTVQEEGFRGSRGVDTQGHSQMVGDRSVVGKQDVCGGFGNKEQRPVHWWELKTGSCPPDSKGNHLGMVPCCLLSCVSYCIYQQAVAH